MGKTITAEAYQLPISKAWRIEVNFSGVMGAYAFTPDELRVLIPKLEQALKEIPYTAFEEEEE